MNTCDVPTTIELNVPVKRRLPFRVAVEGNIGSGKSTFLEFCRSAVDVEVCPEPVDLWRDVDGHNLLGDYYRDPPRWAMAFQAFVTLTTVQNHIRGTDKLLQLTERSLQSSLFCFIRCMEENAAMEPGMSAVLKRLHEFCIKTFDMRPDAIVYVQTSPEMAYERMKMRNRDEEASVTLSFLAQLHRAHEEWISREHDDILNGKSDTTVLVLNGDLHIKELEEKYKSCLSDLRVLAL